MEIRLAGKSHRRLRAEHREGELKPVQLQVGEGREAGVLEGGAVAVVGDVDDQGPPGFRGADAAPELVFAFQGHEARPSFRQLGRVSVGAGRQRLAFFQSVLDRPGGEPEKRFPVPVQERFGNGAELIFTEAAGVRFGALGLGGQVQCHRHHAFGGLFISSLSRLTPLCAS